MRDQNRLQIRLPVSPTPSKTHHHLIALFVVVVAVVLRVPGLRWGLPSVYEEATPLLQAWEMWNWKAGEGIDWNPHFFNYPSLTFYIQFLAQWLLFHVMKLAGTIDSSLDFRVLYEINATPFFLLGRKISVFFAAATVGLSYLVGRKIGGTLVGFATAALLAVNTFYISRSQMIEVDVPLTFFVVLFFWFALRLLENPTKNNYLMAGVSIGLAASTKYTGAVLALPLVVGHMLTADKTPAKRRPWGFLLIALAVAAVTFAVTSPFVLIDYTTFWEHFSTEREHMRAGHFGLDRTSTWGFYSAALTDTVAGWPIVLFSLFGLVYLVFVRRHPGAVVLAVFLVPYFLMLNGWAMKANRYLLPMLPVTVLFATAGFSEALRLRQLVSMPRPGRRVAAVVGFVLLATPAIIGYPKHFQARQHDTRTEGRLWVERNVAAGSFIATEVDGPDLRAVHQLQNLEHAVRARILENTTSPVYAVQVFPMVQVKPERSDVFYDIGLYRMADMIVTTGSARSRYTADPVRFRHQVTFYDSLETRFQKVYEIRPQGGSGPTLTFYRNTDHVAPFGRRGSVDGPRTLAQLNTESSGREGSFYNNLGINYETYSYWEGALASYEMGLSYRVGSPTTYRVMIFGKARCLVFLGRGEEAKAYVSRMADTAPTQGDRQQMTALLKWVNEETAAFQDR